MQTHTEKSNKQQQEFNTATASGPRLGDSIDTQRINIDNTLRGGELHLDTTTTNISKPLGINSNINSNHQPQLLPASTNGNMPSSFTSTLTNGSTSVFIQQHQLAQQPQQQRRGSAYPEQCWGVGDAGLGSSGYEKKTLVLCFDGTGNKFKGNSGDTNILKIFSMLDRRKGDQYHYYQRKFTTLHINTSTR